MALSGAQKVKLAEEIKERDYQELISQQKVHIENKNQSKGLDRVINQSRYEEQQLSERDACMAKAKQEHICKQEKLAAELNKLKTKDIREIKMRQLLRENCPELKELESKLKTAYVNKELAAHLAEKKAQRLQQKINEQKINEVLENARSKEEELKFKRAQEEIHRKALYKQELQDQMILKEKLKRCDYESFLQEKKMQDEIVQRIQDEDERERQEKECRRRKTQEEMMAFKAAQEVWKRKERDVLEEEHKNIQMYLQSRQSDIDSRNKEREANEAIREKIRESIAQQIALKEAEKREREAIMLELLEEEQREEIERRAREQREKEIRTRHEIQESLSRQLEEKEERLRQEAAEDASYKEQLIAKLAEDERLEQLSTQKRRLKMLQLRKDVEEMMKERRRRRAEEMQELMRLMEEEQKEQAERERVIAEERLRMLEEHVESLNGFLPKGVIKSDELAMMKK